MESLKRLRPGAVVLALLVGPWLVYNCGVAWSLKHTDCHQLQAQLQINSGNHEEIVQRIRTILDSHETIEKFPLLLAMSADYERLFQTAGEHQHDVRRVLMEQELYGLEELMLLFAMRGLPDEEYLGFAEDMIRFRECGWIDDDLLYHALLSPFVEYSPVTRESWRPRIRAQLRYVRSTATDSSTRNWLTSVLRGTAAGTPFTGLVPSFLDPGSDSHVE